MIGYEALIEGGDGMRVMGARQTDEVFTGEGLVTLANPSGTLNVSFMWQDIMAGLARGLKAKSTALNSGVMASVAKRDIDRETVARITKRDAEKPIIMIARGDGTHSLVDGVHRLTWLHQKGARMVDFFEFPESAIDDYAVRILVRYSHGPWITQTPEMLFAKTFGTYAMRDAGGNIVGIRDERPKA